MKSFNLFFSKCRCDEFFNDWISEVWAEGQVGDIEIPEELLKDE
jgi:hypothetical protein